MAGGVENRLVSGYKLPVIKRIMSREVIDSIVIVVDNTAYLKVARS